MSLLGRYCAIGRDLVGSAALGATVAIAMFCLWLSIQFGAFPTVARLSSTASTITLALTAFYAALWIARAAAPAAEAGPSGGSFLKRWNFAPAIRASGNAVMMVVATELVVTAADLQVDHAAIRVYGYVGVFTLIMARELATSSSAIRS
jgi:hypothetical protein